MVQVSFREEEKQCPLKDLRVGVERGKKERNKNAGREKKKKKKERKRKKEARLFFPEWVTHNLK